MGLHLEPTIQSPLFTRYSRRRFLAAQHFLGISFPPAPRRSSCWRSEPHRSRLSIESADPLQRTPSRTHLHRQPAHLFLTRNRFNASPAAVFTCIIVGRC